MKKIVLLVILLLMILTSIVLADDLVIYKSEWLGKVIQGYHLIKENYTKQEVYFDDSIEAQSDFLVKIFSELYGVPSIEKLNEDILAYKWKTDKEIIIKISKDFMVLQISDIE